MSESSPLHEFRAAPVFALTGDQDWAPDWALEATLELTASLEVPFHLFVTNRSRLLDSPLPGHLTLGIHPNFLPGSSHGATEARVIATCLELVPDATTFRSHSFHQNSRLLAALRSAGLVAGSNLLCFLQPELVPLIDSAGLIQLPVAFEDDTFLERAAPPLDLGDALALLMTPGLKVLNFHPSLVALNAPALSYYDARRPRLFASRPRRLERHQGRGTATLLREVVTAARQAGHEFIDFPQLVRRAQASHTSLLPALRG